MGRRKIVLLNFSIYSATSTRECEEAGKRKEWEDEGYRLYRSFRRKSMPFVIQKVKGSLIFDKTDRDNGLLNKQDNQIRTIPKVYVIIPSNMWLTGRYRACYGNLLQNNLIKAASNFVRPWVFYSDPTSDRKTRCA